MTDATVARGGTTVTLPLLGEGTGAPLAIRDIGKPQLDVKESGELNPRFVDVDSGQTTYTLQGLLYDSTAYDDAIALADLVKSGAGGNATTLNIDTPEFDTDIATTPAPTDGALTLTYRPGWRGNVVTTLSLVRVNEVLGSVTQSAATPTASGSGPLTLSNGGTAVTLETALTVERTVGRPNTSLNPIPGTLSNHPNYYDRFAAAGDRFDISCRFVHDAVSKVNGLESIVQSTLSRTPLTLDFQGLFGMGAFDVVPEGSGAVRTVRASAEEGTVNIPSLALRVVQ